MNTHTFIDRYFQSHSELVDVRFSEERDINTLFTYLENLHSTADKLKDQFDSNIKDVPEFKLLRVIRNYFHHVGDIDELRMFVSLDKDVLCSHSEHIIISLELFAKSFKSFIDNGTVKKENRNYQRKLNYVSREVASIMSCCDCGEMIRDLPKYCDKPKLKLDGSTYELGFDLFRFIYNITNCIADICNNISDLCAKDVVRELDSTYTASNNIDKADLLSRASNVPTLTTKGFITAEKVEAAI